MKNILKTLILEGKHQNKTIHKKCIIYICLSLLVEKVLYVEQFDY